MLARKTLHLLVVEDSDDDYRLLVREIERGGYAVVAQRVATARELTEALQRRWDVMIADWLLPSYSALAAIAAVRGRDLPVIVTSGTPNEDDAITAIHAGALDFVSKDRPARFVPAIERALREADEHRARLAAERELRLSEERYRSAFELAPEPLLTYDLATARVIDANRAAQQLLGRSLGELRTTPFPHASAPVLPDGRRSDEVARDLIRRLLRGADLAPFEWIVRSASGEEIPVELHLVRLASESGTMIRVTMIDLRERRKLEEIRQRTVELELQNRRIQEANRLKSEFLANMSHELRTPLNAIIGFAELLYDRQVPVDAPEHREFLADILTSGRHLLQLINDVLDLAKVEAGKLELRPERVDLARLLGEVVAVTRTTAAAKHITVETEVDPSLQDIVIDPSRFKQVAYNYLSNALKFTPDGGRITIRAQPADDQRFRLEVEDTGVGISPADLGKLFVEFEQLEGGAAKRHQGTGLGLALSRRLVEAQGGSVGVRSTLGAGSTFHAVLPRHADARQAERAGPLGRLGTRTILVVEDDDREREVIATTLARAGFGFELARTGRDAIARCQARAFDAITLDLLLPDMSGLEVLETLRDRRCLNGTPVIVVTVAADVELAGVTIAGVLHKPLDRDALLSALREARMGVAR